MNLIIKLEEEKENNIEQKARIAELQEEVRGLEQLVEREGEQVRDFSSLHYFP